jgi:hypothetical protein
MAANDNHRPRPALPSGSDNKANDRAKVIAFPRLPHALSPFDRLTATLIVAQHRAGTLPEAILVALLAAVLERPR